MRLPWQLRAVFRPIDRNAPIDLQVQIEGWRRMLIWGGIGLLFLVAVVVFAKPGVSAVKAWHARRLVKEAEGLMAARNWAAASEKVSDAFTFSPAEPSVLLAAARLTTETGGTTQAYEMWQRVCNQPVVQPEHRLELAVAAVRAGRPVQEAAAALAQAGAAASTARGRFAAAAIALRQGDQKGALDLLREAVRLEPTNPTLKLQLASGLLYRAARDKAAQAEAALLLYEVQKDPRDGVNARRMLRQLRLQTGDIVRARDEAMAIISMDGSGIEDRLALAGILKRQGDRTTLEGVLTPLVAEANRNRVVAAAVVNWMLEQGHVTDAARLLEKVPPDWRRVPPLSLSYARHLDDTRRVADLREHLRTADWTGVEPEREAWNSRLAQLQNSERLRSETWAGIERRATGDREMMARLLAVSKPWRWHAERIRLLQQLAALPPVDKSVLEDWLAAGLAAGQTADVCEAAWQLIEQGESDANVRSDAARSALLLNRRIHEARKLADEVYNEQPGQPDFAATQAAALRNEGKFAEAQRILSPWVEMAARGGRLPDRVAYERAVTLAASGDAKGAAIAAQPVAIESLLPEEVALVRKLRGGN